MRHCIFLLLFANFLFIFVVQCQQKTTLDWDLIERKYEVQEEKEEAPVPEVMLSDVEKEEEAVAGFVCSHRSWSYTEEQEDGDVIMEEWKTSFPLCAGNAQSPINISTDEAEFLDMPPIDLINYEVSRNHFTILNTGHTVEILLDIEHNKPLPCINGANLPSEYCFRQLIFHWSWDNLRGSEHEINGSKGCMEIQIVHALVKDRTKVKGKSNYVVLAVIFEAVDEKDNIYFEDIVKSLKKIKFSGKKLKMESGSLRLSDLLPDSGVKSFYHYQGSLTSPPCWGSVSWYIVKDWEPLSKSQMEQFRTLLHTEKSTEPNNVYLTPTIRDAQEINERKVFKNFK